MDFSDCETFLKILILKVLSVAYFNRFSKNSGFLSPHPEGHLLQMVNAVLTPLSCSQAQVDR